MAAATGAGSQRSAWLLFGPAISWVGLRWLLDWMTQRAAAPPAWPLTTFDGAPGGWAWLLRPALLSLAAVLLLALLARWLLRRHGARALWRRAAGAWCLLWAAGCAAQIVGFANLRGLRALAPLAAEVVGAREQAPTLRSPGGRQWLLRVEGAPALQLVLVQDERAAAVALHTRLRLHASRGRWYGRYVSGWDMLAPPP